MTMWFCGDSEGNLLFLRESDGAIASILTVSNEPLISLATDECQLIVRSAEGLVGVDLLPGR